MPQYPRTQSAVSGLIDSMIAGYGEHPGDFPNADVATLQTARDEYHAASEALLETHAAAAVAAQTKLAKLDQLNAVAKAQLKISQVDTLSDPLKLEFIGWGPTSEPQSTQPPHQPGYLQIISQDVGPDNNGTTKGTASRGGNSDNAENVMLGILHLRWEKSAFKRTRYVRYYSIERRPTIGDGHWNNIASSLTDEIILKEEPTGIRFEYRVKAVNAAGESFPSNLVSVTL